MCMGFIFLYINEREKVRLAKPLGRSAAKHYPSPSKARDPVPTPQVWDPSDETGFGKTSGLAVLPGPQDKLSGSSSPPASTVRAVLHSRALLSEPLLHGAAVEGARYQYTFWLFSFRFNTAHVWSFATIWDIKNSHWCCLWANSFIINSLSVWHPMLKRHTKSVDRRQDLWNVLYDTLSMMTET